MEAWIKGEGGSPGNTEQIFAISSIYVLYYQSGGGFKFADGYNTGLGAFTPLDTTGWHEVAGVVSGVTDNGNGTYAATFSSYIDGQFVNSYSVSSMGSVLSRATAVGANPNGGSEAYIGSIYEPKITLGALSPSQFEYASSTTPEPGSLAVIGLGSAGLLARRSRRSMGAASR